MPICVIAGDVIVGEFGCMSLDAARRLHRFGQSEVEHLHRAVGADFHVGGLEIAVDDPLLVCGFERVGDLFRDGEGFVDRQRPARDAVGQRRPFDQLHHERRRVRLISRARKSRRCSDDSARRALRLRAGTARGDLASAATASGSTLMATARFRFVSVARHTSPMPPAPSWAITS